ncbi:hypothetical protein GCM10010431_18470 [Streptomyces kunmingensis]
MAGPFPVWPSDGHASGTDRFFSVGTETVSGWFRIFAKWQVPQAVTENGWSISVLTRSFGG